MFFPLKDENPTKTFPYMTLLLISVNCIIFFIGLSYGQDNIYRKYGVIPFEITHAVDQSPEILLGPYITLITSLFLHGSFFHLLGNMWFLWIFGNNIEDVVGRFKFLIFYLIGGIAASFLQIIFSVSSDIPVIGASGAVSAISSYLLQWLMFLQ